MIVERKQRSLTKRQARTGAFVNCLASGLSEEDARNRLRAALLELGHVPTTLGEAVPFETYKDHGQVDRNMLRIAGDLAMRPGAECLVFHEYDLDEK